MRFTVNTMDFRDALAKVKKATYNSKGTLPYLSECRLTAEDNSVIISATNLVQYAKFRIDADVSEPGDVLLYNTKQILAGMKYFKEDITAFSTEKDTLKLVCGNKKADQPLFGENILKESWPETPVPDDSKSEFNKYNASLLSNRFGRISYAVFDGESRPAMTGVHFVEHDMVACDGYRLALNTDSELNIEKPFTVPLVALSLVKELLTGDIFITHDAKHIVFTDGIAEITSRLLDGEFLNHKKAFPENFAEETVIDGAQVSESLKYLKAVTSLTGTTPIKWEDNTFSINTSFGNGESEVGGGFSFEIGFRMSYMLDAITQIGKDKPITVKGTNYFSPLVLTTGGADTALLLPVKLVKTA